MEEKYTKWIKPILTVVVLVIVFFAMFTGGIQVTLSDSHLVVSGGLFVGTQQIDYDDITGVELAEDLDIGQRRVGVGSIQLQAGSYHNTRFGDYQLFSYSNNRCYVVVQTNSGVVVFNSKTKEETYDLYARLQQKLQV